MKILKYLSIIFFTVFVLSCEKHKLEYNAAPVDDSQVLLQLNYVVPATSIAGNYIIRVDLNNKPVSYANLVPFDLFPNSVGRFVTVKEGDVNIKLYKTVSGAQELVYDRNVNLPGGKRYNVFVYQFDKDPIVIDNGYPYVQEPYPIRDSVCYFKFYNFYHDADGITPLCKQGEKLQLQYVYYTTTDCDAGWTVYAGTTDTFNLGEPIAFGETTGWHPVRIRPTHKMSYGWNPLRIFVRLIKADGTKVWLPYLNSAGVQTTYTWSTTTQRVLGRRYNLILCGRFGGSGGYSNQIWNFKEFNSL
ncbi:MAG: hypothetical protein LBT56_06705 [Prevotellaceae bacterium]|jgi:hypothetical protein|nr:hypothetical protein [Prevotellaceae bacterium]